MCFFGVWKGNFFIISVLVMLVVVIRWCGSMVMSLELVMMCLVVKNWFIVSRILCLWFMFVSMLLMMVWGLLDRFISR